VIRKERETIKYFHPPMTSVQSLVERNILPFVEKPLRYTGGELNVVKKDLSAVALHGVLCFPDLYDLGMSHLGIQILYHIINKNPAWALSRCFTPWIDAEKLMREQGIPLYALEYWNPLAEADWIGFSVQYELQYSNIINMLDLAQIPVRSCDRDENDPIVIAGGPCVANPEPLAEFIDAFAIGDGEETIVAICSFMEKAKQEHLPRAAVLHGLSGISGVYVPSLCQVSGNGSYLVCRPSETLPVRAAKVISLAREYYPPKPIVPLMNVVHHRLGIEVMRGCTHGCRFCSAGVYYRPVREKTAEALLREIEEGISATGWRDVGLMSLSSADYSCFGELLAGSRSLKDRYHIAFSLPSTRIDALTGEQIDLLTAGSQVSSMTIAPEAGSERLRTVINKDFTDEAIYRVVTALLSRNVQTIKLYFMIGLPTETQEDIDAIVNMVAKIAGLASAASRRRSVNVSLSPFSPKPHTPFQWEAMDAVEILEQKNHFIKNSLRRCKNVRVSYRRIATTLLETVMARGDRRICSVIFNAWKRGARFDGWDEQFQFERWVEAAREASVDFTSFLDSIPLEQELPWAVVDTGVSVGFLQKERERALNREITTDCRLGECLNCGVCDTKIQRKIAGAGATARAAVPQVTYGRTPVKKTPATFRYRFVYSKGPGVRFLGHLDMVAVFIRALIASGCECAFSQGFQPHPKVSFGPPLACGCTALAEAFDVTTVARFDVPVDVINTMLPGDLSVRSCVPIYEGEASLTASIKAAIYRFTPLESIAPQELAKRIAAALEANELRVRVVKNEKGTVKNVRPMIKTLEVDRSDYAVSFTAVLSHEPGATCKPSELIRVLFPERSFTDFITCREKCLVERQGDLVPV
jgi:radical SAM family uncharacterized protein/radical SAM-linked protein